MTPTWPPDPERDNGADHSPEEPDPLDVDRAFAAIVAGWADDAGAGSWPEEENLSPATRRVADEPDDAKPDRDDVPPADPADPVDLAEPVDLAGGPATGPLLPPIGRPEPREIELEEFVPPEPPPIPRGDAFTMLAWAGVIIGPIFLLTAVIAWRTAPQVLVLTAISGFVGGFIVLVSRMPKHRDDDDDGAVV
jgi:hypothetical protein